MENNGLTGAGTQEKPFVLSDPLKWKDLSDKVYNYTGDGNIYIKLDTDIDFNETEFNIGITKRNINDFRIYNKDNKYIYFNGNDKTLKNLKFSKISDGQQAFYLKGLENLNICNVICGSGYGTGVIYINLGGYISNCNFSFYLLNPESDFRCIYGGNNTSMYLSTINIGGISSSINSFFGISEMCNCHINFDQLKTKLYTTSGSAGNSYLLYASSSSSFDTCYFSGHIMPILLTKENFVLSTDNLTFYSCFIDLDFIFNDKKDIKINLSNFNEINLIKKPDDSDNNAKFTYIIDNTTTKVYLLSESDLMESEKVSATGFPYIRV